MELIRHHDIPPRFDIITVSKTWPSDTDNVQDYLIDGFQIPFVLNRPTHPGGVLCLGWNDIVTKRRKDLKLNGLEALWLEIRHKIEKILLFTTYWPPCYLNLYDIFQSALDKVHESNAHDCTIIGDLNSDPNTLSSDKLNRFAMS